jgi:bla regulator protein blaR1
MHRIAQVASPLVLACWLAPQPVAFAQSQSSRPKFEVASVKASDPQDPRTFMVTPPNGSRFSTTGASLKFLIGIAYEKAPAQVSGGPSWLDTDRFEIDARPDTAVPGLEGYKRTKLMLQSLLEERFKLAVHTETRQESVYELVLTKTGSKLKEVSFGVPRQEMRRGELLVTSTRLSFVTPIFSTLVQRPVIDKTGLAGVYDFTLKFRPEPNAAGAAAPDAPPLADPEAPGIFTAIQEQLGLRLESAKGPVEILVVDHAEKPEAN